MSKVKFKVGGTVVKARKYSKSKVTKNTLPSEAELTTGMKGVVVTVKENDLVVKFENGLVWHVAKSEMNNAKPESTTRFMAYGDGCRNKSSLLKTEEELKTELERLSDNTDWTGQIIGYKLTPLYSVEKKTVLVKVK